MEGFTQTKPPAAKRNTAPDRFNHTKGPRALQEPIDRTERACTRKSECEPGRTRFERVADKHCGDGEETKCREFAQFAGPRISERVVNG
jgi:hypothetical protein